MNRSNNLSDDVNLIILRTRQTLSLTFAAVFVGRHWGRKAVCLWLHVEVMWVYRFYAGIAPCIEPIEASAGSRIDRIVHKNFFRCKWRCGIRWPWKNTKNLAYARFRKANFGSPKQQLHHTGYAIDNRRGCRVPVQARSFDDWLRWVLTMLSQTIGQ